MSTHRTVRTSLLAALLVTVVVVAGCSSSSKTAATTTTASKAPSDAGSQEDSPQAIFAHGWPPPGSGGTCDGRTPGKGKILMTFCKGTANLTFHFTLGASGTRTLSGGTCWINGSNLEIDWGSATGEGFTGAIPDYFTILMPSAPGPFSTSGMLALDGKARYFSSLNGVVAQDLDHSKPIPPTSLDKVKGDFNGTDFLSDYQFQATFNCDGTPPHYPTVAELIERAQTAVPQPSKN